MDKRSRPRQPQTPPQHSKADLEKSLGELARHVNDEKAFLLLAKQAWRDEHYQDIPTRGRPSVVYKCFNAIIDGFEALDMSSDPVDNYTGIGNLDEIVERNPPRHQRLPLGRLVQMIRDRIPHIPIATARKYARLWEREMYYDLLTTKTRMALYKQMKKKRPGLYKDTTLKPRR